MRKNTHDQTLYRNYVRKWKFLIQEYELVKQQRHPKVRFVADFYRVPQTPPADLLEILSPVPPEWAGAGLGAPAARAKVETSAGLRVY